MREHARRVAAIALIPVVVLALGACNPINASLNYSGFIPGAGDSWNYTGTQSGWLEVQIKTSPVAHLQVRGSTSSTGVYCVGDQAYTLQDQYVTCDTSSGHGSDSPNREAWLNGSYGFKRVIGVNPGDQVGVVVYFPNGDGSVYAKPVDVTVRVVNGNGQPTGDIVHS